MLTKEQEELVARLLKPRPKPRLVSRTEFSAEVERERATRAAREAAEAERREIEAAKERERKIKVFEAVHYHALESKWHAQQAESFGREYRGFHSRND